ncbi:MAG: T9SS type A sorting domain-containing protein [Bacteroidales bacterium]
MRNLFTLYNHNLIPMIEVYNLDGMPVYKYRSESSKAFEISDLEAKGLPCGVYFVKVKANGVIQTSKLLIC